MMNSFFLPTAISAKELFFFKSWQVFWAIASQLNGESQDGVAVLEMDVEWKIQLKS